MREIEQLSREFGAKCNVLYYEKDPKTKIVASVPRVVSLNAAVTFSHMQKPVDARPRLFQYCKTADQVGSVAPVFNQKFDQNSLSDPALLQIIKDAGYEKKESEPVSLPVKSLDDYTPEELIEYLKSKNAISGKVKNLLEPEPETKQPESGELKTELE